MSLVLEKVISLFLLVTETVEGTFHNPMQYFIGLFCLNKTIYS